MQFFKDGNPVTNIDWTPPSTRSDGTPYVDTDHKGYELGLSNPNDPTDGFVPHISFPTSLGATSWPYDQLNITAEGDYEAALRTVDNGDRVSVWSNPILFTVSLAPPNPPTGLSAS